jgi:hypothetical protein
MTHGELYNTLVNLPEMDLSHLITLAYLCGSDYERKPKEGLSCSEVRLLLINRWNEIQAQGKAS